ncbi:MAG: saccharopine dehydrogenase C-terminal domain-containing protein [Gammaproteobacteria bacterium]
MCSILILGAGKIGACISALFLQESDYQVTVVDRCFEKPDFKRLQKKYPALKVEKLDIQNESDAEKFFNNNQFDAVISCLPFFVNATVAAYAAKYNMHYFDLTEDVHVTAEIKKIAKNSKVAFVPQCGLAPGITGIIAYDLVQHFEKVESIKLRVGALPQHTTHALHYALTWSTEGMINQYINDCSTIREGKHVLVPAMQDLELIEVEGLRYEAFNTSGGLGSLTEICDSNVNTLNYKTIRYIGHCEKMRFLLFDLRLIEERETLKRILERAIPTTYQDVVMLYISADGWKHGHFVEESFVARIFPQIVAELEWSAIQIATATGACMVVDHILSEHQKYKGLVLQETLPFPAIKQNRFYEYVTFHQV